MAELHKAAWGRGGELAQSLLDHVQAIDDALKVDSSTRVFTPVDLARFGQEQKDKGRDEERERCLKWFDEMVSVMRLRDDDAEHLSVLHSRLKSGAVHGQQKGLGT